MTFANQIVFRAISVLAHTGKGVLLISIRCINLLTLIYKSSERVWLYLIVPFIALFQGLNQPNGTAIISNLANRERQGEILGINQSISALAQAVPPIIAGFVAAVNINLPTWFAAGATLLAWLIFKVFFKEEKMTDEELIKDL